MRARSDVLVRNAMFRRVELLARRQWDALGGLDGDAGRDASRWEEAFGPHWDDHAEVGIGAAARGPGSPMIETHSRPVGGAPDHRRS